MRAAVLVRNETIKATRRLAFWVCLLAYSGILSIVVGESVMRALRDPDRSFGFPTAWTDILTEMGPLPGLFGAVALILLISSEFTFRTSRQNVIDGLSKEQFFLGKLILYPMVVAAFMCALVILGGGLSTLSTDWGALEGLPVRPVDVALLAGVTLAVVGYMSMAFFAAFATRAAGAAMGLYFLYVALGEQLLQGIVGRSGEVGRAVAGVFPRGLFDRLFRVAQFDQEARQRAIDRALEAGNAAPEFMNNAVLVGCALAWIAVFVGLAFYVYERRDL